MNTTNTTRKIRTTVTAPMEGYNRVEYGTFDLTIAELAWLREYGYNTEYLIGKKRVSSYYENYGIKAEIKAATPIRPTWMFEAHVKTLKF